MIIPEQIYQEYHKWTFYYKNGQYPKTVKNFDKAKEKDTWVYFERLSQKIKNANGLINYKIFIKALAEHYEGWFPPKLLLSLKGIKIYKLHNQIKNSTNDKENIYNGILRSISFIVDFCIENDLNGLDEYTSHNHIIFPSILKHLHAGSITGYFLSIVPQIKIRMQGLPQDFVNEFASEFLNEYDITRSKAISITKVRKICNKLNHLIITLIERQNND